ncbi:MAG TPA: hypothetical protein VM370_01185 [Candidatus Thermoplasmatota archaeon]|nr:hypothetical protein [Candidatus Thermoplasmatota archaeon]
MQPLVLAGALAAGAGLSALAVWAAIRYTRAPSSRDVPMEIVDESPVSFTRAALVPQAPEPRPQPPAARAPPPASPRAHAERAPAMVLTQGVTMQDAEFERRARSTPAPTQGAVRRPPPEMKSWAQQVRESAAPSVETEWARRQVGPVEAGRVAGVCGGCGSRLSVTDRRPLRIACPVCGRNKLVA